MSQRIQLKRGLHANLPTTGMLVGEPLVTTDRGTIHLATGATDKIPVVPDLPALTALASVTGAEDLLLVHDASEVGGQKEKKVTFNTFKDWLNIPAGSTDEMVAVVDGGTAGYVWGTDGTDGIFRMGTSMAWTKDAGDGFVTLNVNVIDGGTF